MSLAKEKLLHTLVRIGRRRIEQVQDERRQQRRQLHVLQSRQAGARQAMEDAMRVCQAHARAMQSLLSRREGFCIEEYLAQRRYQDILRDVETQARRKLAESESAVDAQERLLGAMSMQLVIQERKLQCCERRLRCAMEQAENRRQDRDDEEIEEVCAARIISRRKYPEFCV